MRRGISRRQLIGTAATIGTAALAGRPAFAASVAERAEEAARLELWHSLREDLFGARDFAPGDHLVRLTAPERALDASLVPVGLELPGGRMIRRVAIVIDENPVPLAADFTFGPASDRGPIEMKMRVNSYTNMHAVVETETGEMFEVARFVKASGGCSAPAGMSDAEAMRGMGDIHLKLARDPAATTTATARLMIRHPNFTGLQMNEETRGYTPARFISRIEVTSGDAPVFVMEGGISVSSNPVIHFSFIPHEKSELTVRVVDSDDARWERRVPVDLAVL